ncbi:hypothetical protein OG352_37005 [Streptomyces sp. NBC_01485]|uniref:hypothetical protein n=1 Tax=Streptomyces sp. NBC_01485 TaxID=2903884 RepID=UPI002E374EA4|nr:hypothetical protein [Streptomyces sp. NBC_01485]
MRDRAAREHGVHGGGAMSARLRGIARGTEEIVEAGGGGYRASGALGTWPWSI